MDYLQTVLPIIIYFLLMVILIVGIILGIRLIRTMTKIEKVVDDVNQKVESLNGLFRIIDFTTDKIVGLTDTIVEKLSLLVSKLFFGRNKKRKEEEE